MIVVTGAAGFIGHHLVRRLINCTQEKIIGLDNLFRGRWNNLSDCMQDGKLELREGDIRDSKMLLATFQGAHTVFHLAAQSNVLGAIADIDYSFQTNVVGTFNVLREAKKAGVQCVVFTSSREVYGEPNSLPVDEDAPLGAKNLYGASKVAAEMYCRVFNSPQFRVVVLRLANVYGIGDRDRVIPIFIERAKQGLPLLLYGGDQIIDFVPVDLVVEVIMRATTVKPSGPINVGSGRGTALKDLAKHIVNLAGSKAGWQIAPVREAEMVRFVASTKRMRKELGVVPPSDPLENLPTLFHEKTGKHYG